MKILVIIEITEPLLMNTGFWETNQLSLLHTRHKIKKWISSSLVPGVAGISAYTHSCGLSVPRFAA